jgi:hypothetical protein
MMIGGVHMMEGSMTLTKPGRQLGLFTPDAALRARLSEKTARRAKSLLAEERFDSRGDCLD